MERLTLKGYQYNQSNFVEYGIHDMANKLREYEDAEEQGLLLRLPIAEGTQVFCIGSCGELCDDYETDCEACGEHQVVFCMNFDRNMIEQFGETVFATEKEAEAMLQMMQDDEQMETSNFCIEGYIEIVDPEEAELMMQQEDKQ